MKLKNQSEEDKKTPHAMHEGKMNHQHHPSNNQMSDMDHEMNHSMHMGNFRKKFWCSLILAIPIIILSPMMGIELPFQIIFPGSEWLVLVLATILFFYGGQPFFEGAKLELKKKSPAMMMLISMGIFVAYFYSLYAFIMNQLVPEKHVMDFFWELATLIVIMLLGHWLEMNAINNANDALQKMAELLPDTVVRLTKIGEEEIPLQQVKEQDHLLIKAGDKIPTDGEILKGNTSVDESMVTGEAIAINKKEHDFVIGGSVNGSGVIEILVTGTGETSYLSKIMTMVEDAQKEKSTLESLSDKVAKWLFYIALFVGILTFIVWLLVNKNIGDALQRMVTVFIIACPHALGLAIPLVITRSTSIAAKHGLLVKNRNALEQANALNYIMLDKTGTLTEGKFTVLGIELLSDTYTKEEALKYIGALERNSNHPLASGMMNYFKAHQILSYKGENVQTISGVGLSGDVAGKQIKIVNEKETDRLELTFNKAIKKSYQEQGSTLSYLLIDDQLIAMIALGDRIKPAAKGLIHTLNKKNLIPVMLTGDNKDAAVQVAEYLGITKFYGELLPEDKEEIIKKYLDDGKKVMMVGDGVNDAPSLVRATIGVAIGAGTDVAIDSADVVLTDSDPEDILRFLDLAKETRRKMIQNLWWGAGYNIVAIPLAAGILAPIGIVLSPAVGAVLMSLSTIIVAANAMTLRIRG